MATLEYFSTGTKITGNHSKFYFSLVETSGKTPVNFYSTPLWLMLIFPSFYQNTNKKLNCFNLWTSQKVWYYGLMRWKGREKSGAGCFGPTLFTCTKLYDSSINQKDSASYCKVWSSRFKKLWEACSQISFYNGSDLFGIYYMRIHTRLYIILK